MFWGPMSVTLSPKICAGEDVWVANLAMSEPHAVPHNEAYEASKPPCLWPEHMGTDGGDFSSVPSCAGGQGCVQTWLVSGS